MHEFSIASEIWASVAKAARGHGSGRVKSVKLEIGVLNLLAEEQMRFWIEMLGEQSGSPGVAVQITYLPARVKCNGCGAESETPLPEGELDHFLPPPVACPACGSQEVSIVGGREIRVVSAEVEQSNAAKG
jgi:hydrogenase nickel incorporation protein HypA/HybF